MLWLAIKKAGPRDDKTQIIRGSAGSGSEMQQRAGQGCRDLESSSAFEAVVAFIRCCIFDENQHFSSGRHSRMSSRAGGRLAMIREISQIGKDTG